MKKPKKNQIHIRYDGAFPNLCSGTLIVTINDEQWVFPDYCMSSGGSVWFDEGWDEHVEHGEWSIKEWTDKFPKNMKKAVLNKINEEIPHGCCGGCV